MVFDNGKINTSQLYQLIVTGVSGIGCLLTTDISVAFGGAKGLICLLMAAVLSGLYAELILWLCKKTGWQYRVWAQKHLYKPLRVVIVGLAGIRCLFLLTAALLVLLRLTKSEILSETGYALLLLPVIFLTGYAAVRGTEARARLSACLFWPVMIMLWLPVFLGAGSVRPSFVWGTMQSGPGIMAYLQGAGILFLIFSPIELILLSSDHFLAGEKTGRAVRRAVWTVAGLNVLYYIMITGNISTKLAGNGKDSTVRFVRNVSLPYLMFEKQGVFFLLFFMISVFLTVFCLAGNCYTLFCQTGGHFAKKPAVKRTIAAAVLVAAFSGVTAGTRWLPSFAMIKRRPEVRVQIDQRQYADCMLIGYDTQTQKYSVYLTVGGKNGETHFLHYGTEELTDLKELYRSSLAKRLDLSHVEAVILNQAMLKDPAVLRKVTRYIDQEEELSDNLNVCVTTQPVEAFVKQALNYTTAPGIYISRLIENNRRNAGTRFLSLLLFQKGVKKECRLSCFLAEENSIRYVGQEAIPSHTNPQSG